MFRPSRQILPRWTLRTLLVACVFAGGLWLLVSHAGDGYTLGCSSSKECYEVFMDATRRVRENAFMDSMARGEDPLLGPHMLDTPPAARKEDKKNDFLDIPEEELPPRHNHDNHDDEADLAAVGGRVLSPDDEAYRRLTDPNQERIKAAFVVLVRNSEVFQMRSSMRYLEDRFNHKYNYPWIFLNEEPFTEEFKQLTKQMTNAEVRYGLVPKEHWSYPDWINQTLAKEKRDEMESQGILYGGSESYRHMCRYQSGFFALHPLLNDLDYYWRVEPNVKFSCDINYDPFRFMQERNLKYGFTIALEEFLSTVPTLWETTMEFVKTHPQYMYPRSKPGSLFEMVSNDNGWTYNLCHFWSNFEIGSLHFLRSEAYQAYFRHLDRAGGFFYERWGDAPVHSIAVALMLGAEDVHWFYDIGYQHDFFEHCPTEPDWLVHEKCYCDPGTSFDNTDGSCIPLFLNVTERDRASFIVTRPDSN